MKIGSFIVKYSGVVALALMAACVVCHTTCKKGKVGVLNHQKILTQAAPFQVILGEQKKYADAVAARKAEDEKMLQIERALLQKKIKESGKKPEAFKKELLEFQQKAAFYNEKYRVAERLVMRASQAARQQLDPFVQEVLNEMGEKGYTVILPKQGITYNMPQADITDEFIERLNSKNVQIVFPDPAQMVEVNQPAETSDAQAAHSTDASEKVAGADEKTANSAATAAEVKAEVKSEKAAGAQKKETKPVQKQQKKSK